MNAPVPRIVVLIAGLTVVAAGCTGQPAATVSSSTSATSTFRHPAAPVTFTHPAAATSTATATATAAAPAGPPASPTTSWTESAAGTRNLGGPANVRDISAPAYSLERIDRRSVAQVSWAYLVSLLSYSYLDDKPGAGAAKAAAYAVPATGTVVRTSGVFSPKLAWAKVVAMQMVSRAAVTQMTLYVPDNLGPGAQASVHLAWIATLTQSGGGSRRSSGQTTMLLTRQADKTWLVSDNGFGPPD